MRSVALVSISAFRNLEQSDVRADLGEDAPYLLSSSPQKELFSAAHLELCLLLTEIILDCSVLAWMDKHSAE